MPATKNINQAAYFETVRTLLTRITGEGKTLSLKEINAKINELLKASISNEEVIAELMKMAKDMANAHAEGNALGLNAEELAFYDALTRPEAVKDFYRNNELVDMTRELAEMLRRNRTIDWQKKESARAGMRRMIKKLLKKYKYPPEGQDDAIATVLGQCEIVGGHIKSAKNGLLEPFFRFRNLFGQKTLTTRV